MKLYESKDTKIALFRYAIIAPLIVMNKPTPQMKAEFFKSAAVKQYEYIDGSIKKFSIDTIRRYYRSYEKNGLDGLKPKKREDQGEFRKLDDEQKDYIDYLYKEYPRLPATGIYDKLKDDGYLEDNDVSLSTINKYVNLLKLNNGQTKEPEDRHRYAREHINEVWAGDSSMGPYITINGKRQRVWIIGLIDDASRLIVGAEIFLNDNTINLIEVMRKAVSHYGQPTLFNFDNGANYRSYTTQAVVAKLGSKIIYNKPYTPTGKAKIERFWRTMKDQWCSLVKSDTFTNLEEMRDSFANYINKYNNTIHSSLEGRTPSQRFYSESQLIKRLDDTTLNDTFTITTTRKVTNDGLVLLNNQYYEVSNKFNNKEVTISLLPDYTQMFTVDSNGELNELTILDTIANAHRKRAKKEQFMCSTCQEVNHE